MHVILFDGMSTTISLMKLNEIRLRKIADYQKNVKESSKKEWKKNDFVFQVPRIMPRTELAPALMNKIMKQIASESPETPDYYFQS